MENLRKIERTPDYRQWIVELKQKIRQSQIKAAIKVNNELVRLYWELGKEIKEKQLLSKWGKGFFKQISNDLRYEFPDSEGFSEYNLRLMERFYSFYNQRKSIMYQLGTQFNDRFGFVPWRHHVEIIRRSKDIEEALFYINKTIENGWSRAILLNFMENDLFHSQGKVINNFSKTLSDTQCDLAQEILKDPYSFDFLAISEGYKERELENLLTANITKFLLELGHGFAYIGRQVPIKIGKKDFFIDLLFYHLELRCYVVLELKICEFEAEHAGKLGLYVSSINHQRKKITDNPTIGLLICKTKDNVVAEYSLESSTQPIGISEYQLSRTLPDNFKSSLPSIKEIEDSLKDLDSIENKGKSK